MLFFPTQCMRNTAKDSGCSDRVQKPSRFLCFRLWFKLFETTRIINFSMRLRHLDMRLWGGSVIWPMPNSPPSVTNWMNVEGRGAVNQFHCQWANSELVSCTCGSIERLCFGSAQAFFCFAKTPFLCPNAPTIDPPMIRTQQQEIWIWGPAA